MARPTIHGSQRLTAGFTLIELLVVLVLVALLMSVVLPNTVNSIHYAKESALKENLKVLREGIDDYYTDNGYYPAALEELVRLRYIRKLPSDPITENSSDWFLVYREVGEKKGIMDIHSQSSSISSDGSAYNTW